MALRNINQETIAKIIGKAPCTVSQKMADISTFTVNDLVRIADFFGVSLDYLTGRSEHAKPLEVE